MCQLLSIDILNFIDFFGLRGDYFKTLVLGLRLLIVVKSQVHIIYVHSLTAFEDLKPLPQEFKKFDSVLDVLVKLILVHINYVFVQNSVKFVDPSVYFVDVYLIYIVFLDRFYHLSSSYLELLDLQ